jgi:hypothetical protein
MLKAFSTIKHPSLCFLLHYEEKGCFATSVATQFLSYKGHLQLIVFIHYANGHISWIAKLQVIIYMVQLITTQLQFYQNNQFSTTMPLYYNYTNDAMLTSLVVIHLLKSNMWHYDFFWTN